MKKTILVAGSLAYDRIFDYPQSFADAILPTKIHVLNVSFSVGNVRESYGGTAGNIAYTLHLLGQGPRIVSQAGEDFRPYSKWLKRFQLDTSTITVVKSKPTAAAYIITDRDDNQITAFQPGALISSVPWSTLKRLPTSRIDYAIIAPGNPVTMWRVGQLCQRHGIRYLFDPGQSITAFKPPAIRSMLMLSSGLVSNDYELTLLLRRAKLNSHQLYSRLPYVITTLGRKGALIHQGGKIIHIAAAKPRSELDPTGAGDAFRAGFVAGLVQGFSLAIAGRMGALASVYTVERYGTQTHFFSLPQFNRRYGQNYGQTLPLK